MIVFLPLNINADSPKNIYEEFLISMLNTLLKNYLSVRYHQLICLLSIKIIEKLDILHHKYIFAN